MIELKAFLNILVPSVLIGGGMAWITSDHMFFQTGILAGVSFGACIGFMVGTAHKTAIRSAGIERWDDVGPRRKESRLIALTPEKALQSAVKALESIKVSRMEKILENHEVVGITMMSWKSFGERVSISVEEANHGMSLVTVSSAPIIWTTSFDYGKGAWNVNKAFEVIEGITDSCCTRSDDTA